jgi:hypothetical protein
MPLLTDGYRAFVRALDLLTENRTGEIHHAVAGDTAVVSRW